MVFQDIGCTGRIKLSASFPWLNFFLEGYLKSVVYKTPPQSISDLFYNNIGMLKFLQALEMLQNVRNVFENRFYFYLNVKM